MTSPVRASNTRLPYVMAANNSKSSEGFFDTPQIHNGTSDEKIEEIENSKKMAESEATSEVKAPTFWENLTRKDLKHFSKYVNTTATHGVRRIFVGRSKIRRIFWLLLFLGAAVFCLYNCIIQIIFLSQWPTRQSVGETRRESLPFPAVTLCNINGARKSVTDHLNLTDYLSCAFEVYGFTGAMLARSAEHVSNCAKLHIPDNSEQLNYTILEVFRNASQDPSRFIVDCGWFGSNKPFSCDYTNFTGVPTNNGYCYTFNSKDSGDRLETGGPGQRFSFEVTLNIEQEDYLEGYDTAGVFVTIHNQSEPPQPLQSGIAVPPGTHAFMNLNYETHTFLGWPYGTCKESADELDFFPIYNVANCQQNKLFTRVAQSCKCRDPVAPRALSNYQDIPECTLRDLPCVLQEFVDTTRSSRDDDCDEACRNVEFRPSLSFGSFPSRIAEVRIRESQNASDGSPYTAEDVRGNYLKVSIFYEHLIEVTLDQESAYDGILLLADIGGQLGLFLGVSVISMTELFMWIFDEAKDRLLWCKVVRRKLNKKKEDMYFVNPMNSDLKPARHSLSVPLTATNSITLEET